MKASIVLLKAEYSEKLSLIQSGISPALSNGELALGLELPVTAVGRYKSDNPRSRRAVPDRYTRAAINHLLDGSAVLAVRTPDEGRRTVLICERVEAKRLGAEWQTHTFADAPPPAQEAWDDDDLWTQTDSTPTLTACAIEPPAPRRIGELVLSPIGLGGMRLSTPGRPDETAGLRVLHAAFDAGLTWVDTADVYALDETELGHNERLIRRAIETWSGDRDRLLVASKGGLRRKGARWFPGTAPHQLRAACEGTLRALKTDRIDLYQLHVIDRRIPLADSLGALIELQAEGKIRHIGLCNVTRAQFDEACELTSIASVQNKANLFDDGALCDGILNACRDTGILFIAHSPVGGHKGVKRTIKEPTLNRIARAHGTTAHSVALAWLLSLGEHIVAIPGATRIESVQASARALDLALTADDVAALNTRFPTGARVRKEASQKASTPIEIISTPSGPPEVVVVMGSPASGKTSLALTYAERGYVRLNRDELGGKLNGLIPHLKRAAASGARHFVLDNTYPTRKSRQSLLRACSDLGLPVRCLWLDISIEDARFNAARRMVQTQNALLGPVEIKERRIANLFGPQVLGYWQRSFQKPSTEEGFATVEQIPFVRNLGSQYVNKALLLDYDGTLRKTRSGRMFPTDVADVLALPGRREVLERARDEGYILCGVSNQSGIAKGTLSERVARGCFERTNTLLKIEIDFVFCPHPSGSPVCYCRKPLPGMAVWFIEKYHLDPSQCLVVGDLASDRRFAEEAGIAFAHADEYFV